MFFDCCWWGGGQHPYTQFKADSQKHTSLQLSGWTLRAATGTSSLVPAPPINIGGAGAPLNKGVINKIHFFKGTLLLQYFHFQMSEGVTDVSTFGPLRPTSPVSP